jgi:hypothetical protein
MGRAGACYRLLTALMRTIYPQNETSPLSDRMQIRSAVLHCFCDPPPDQCSRLLCLNRADWQRLLFWLDTSGLALYFLERMKELRLSDRLPPEVLARLQRNLIDNTERTWGLVDESIAIQKEFQDVDLSYAVLKGFSLWPHSVPRPELRSQLDLDYLVAEKSAPEARRILEGRGYRLHAVSGRSWEFKTSHPPGRSLAELYDAIPFRAVELHIETEAESAHSVLARAGKRPFHGISMPVLSPADLFLGQGMHLFKHVCSEFSRTAHLLEFQRHVVARRDEAAFWREVRSVAVGNPRACWALGVVTLLITRTMGDFAPEALQSWTVDRLPDAARYWVEKYGCRSVLADFPGSKLYLLLQRQLEAAGIPTKRSLRRSLFPVKLPPPVLLASPQASWPERIRGYAAQLRFIFFRLRFHTVEGCRYMWESFRWEQQMNGRA